jgi:hypothetical protein
MIVSRCCTAFLSATALIGLAALPGCGPGTPSVDTSMNEATVSGVVSVRGVPATGGSILFNPSNSQRIVPTRTAQIGADGSYTIKTLTGINQVSFDGEVATKNRGVALIKEGVEVQSGTNTANFDLMGPNSGKHPPLPTDAAGNIKGGPKPRPK